VSPDEARLQRRRDAALTSMAGGFGLLFLAGFSANLALGGVAMVLVSGPLALYWGRRLRRLRGDPWAYDPELDGPDPRKPREPGWREGDDGEDDF
jgi:hypothetical protein